MKISMKKRKIGYTYGSVSGHFSFRKQKSIAFESTLERDLLSLLEFNDSVQDIIEQPITIEYINKNGKQVTYTPDFLVYFNESKVSHLELERKPFLIEVKPRSKLLKDWNILKPKFKIAMRYAKENDMIFKIYDESRIRTQYLKNILFLKRYYRLEYDLSSEDEILSFVHSIGITTIEHVLEYLTSNKESRGLILSHIWHLLSHKKLLCLMKDNLTIQTNIWINENIEMEIFK